MSLISKVGKRGKIISGELAGYFIRIENDAANTGGFLILTWDVKSGNGFDNWVEKAEDLEPFLKESGWRIEWED